ncbi:hypothetical protein PAPYR_7510 [Paratrimastix pyriformis]|uniref:Uncharacterized protein n=1 Tax=Paratrimastix pyriformis TaxID=342808 RepID=A0ABQ8UG58_9EUKA|nr:hypothetical protein PAPYR_7510 [Paratrimastix pyriformis]
MISSTLPLGIVDELQGPEVSMLLSFFDRWIGDRVLKLDDCPEYCAPFLERAPSAIRRLLAKLHLKAILHPDRVTLSLWAMDSGRAVLPEEFRRLIGKLEERSLVPNLYDFQAVTDATIEALQECTVALFGDLFDPAAVRSIHGLPTVPFLTDWSTDIDVSFQGGGTQINYSDPYRWLHLPAHRQAYERTCPRPGRVPHYHRLFCLVDLPHEFVHCLQALAGLKEPRPSFYSWMTEHDASVLALSLLSAVARRETAKGPTTRLFPLEGTYEEALMEMVATTVGLDATMTGPQQAGFAMWRDSCGLQPPDCFPLAGESVTALAGVASAHFKWRLAVEGGRDSDAGLDEELRTLFAQPARWAPETCGSTTLAALHYGPEHRTLEGWARPVGLARATELGRQWE